MRYETRTLPACCGVAFKEWSGVCQALTDGRQCLIVRKGGIAEENGRFRPEHDAFWLYPTRLHEDQQGLRAPQANSEVSPPPPDGFVNLRALAIVTLVAYLDRLDQIEALADFHVWSQETIRQRFAYRRPGLWALGVRVYRRPEPIQVELRPEHSGCKSWVSLGRPLSTERLDPVLDEEAFALRMRAIGRAMAPSAVLLPRDDQCDEG